MHNLNATFRPNEKQNRSKEHSLKNIVCNRKDNPAGTQFLPFSCVLLSYESMKDCHQLYTFGQLVPKGEMDIKLNFTFW